MYKTVVKSEAFCTNKLLTKTNEAKHLMLLKDSVIFSHQYSHKLAMEYALLFTFEIKKWMRFYLLHHI